MNKTKQKILNKITNFLKQYDEIEFAYVYGSFAKNKETPMSDIDIAIFQNKNKSDYERRMFEFELEAKVMEGITDREVDIRTLNDAPIIVVGKIINEGKLLFARNNSFLNNYVEMNRLKYLDYLIVYKPLLEKRFNNILND